MGELRMIDRLQYISQEMEPGNPESHLDAIRGFCEAGGKWVQLRVKGNFHPQPHFGKLSAGSLGGQVALGAPLEGGWGVSNILNLALQAKEICNSHNAIFILNDYVEIAKEVQADGVHLGKNDMPPLEARTILGPNAIIGGTANTWDDIQFLADSNVDYIGLGPFRFTATKKELSPILGLEGYVEMKRKCERYNIDIPLIAIGGIRQEDVPELMKTGVHGIALSGFLTFHREKQQAVENLYTDLQPKEIWKS